MIGGLMKLNKKIAVLGAGKIGQAIIGGLLEAQVSSPAEITAVTGHAETLEAVSKRYPVRTSLEGPKAAAEADVVIVAVKPQTVTAMLPDVGRALTPRHLLISTVASVPIRVFEEAAREVPVVRTMPNTPCQVRAGMTALTPGRHARGEHLEAAKRIFGTLGRCVVLDEKHMDTVTALSGSGPAFMYVVAESLAEGGVKMGLPRDVATLLAAQTMLGAAKMIVERGAHPALLKDEVTTPAGCTIDGLLELEEGGLRVTLIKAVVRATQRAAELYPGSK